MSLYGGVEIVGKPDLENVRKLDLLPLPMLSDMMRYGIAIDREWFWELSVRLGKEMDVLRGEICGYIPPEKLDEFMQKSNLGDEADSPMNVDSPTQLAELLFDVLKVGKGQQLKTTKSGTRISTGKKQLEKFKREPVVQKVLQYRERAKLKSTYTDSLPNMARLHPRSQSCPVCELKHDGDTWRVHTTFTTTRTTTGRIASKAPNFQNIPTRTELGRLIRKGFVASPGTEMVSVDFSQIEMRLGGHYSGDENLLRIFQLGLDPHTDTARRAFKTETPDKLTQRDPCKNVNFGVFYGLSGEGLLDLMAVTYSTAGMELPEWLDRDWCDDFIEKWFELYPGVREYISQQHYRARRYGIVWDLFGRVRRVPEVRSVHERVVQAGLRQAGNMPVQGTAGDLNKLAMAESHEGVVREARRQGVWCWPLNTVHDELIVEVQQGYGEVVKEQIAWVIRECMRDKQSGEWCCRVPIDADGKVMERWEK